MLTDTFLITPYSFTIGAADVRGTCTCMSRNFCPGLKIVLGQNTARRKVSGLARFCPTQREV